MDIWYGLAKSIVRAYITLFMDSIHVSGKSLLPSGPKIIIANHTNITDAFVLPFLTKEKVHFLIQAETFTLPVIGRLLALADQIPVYLGQGREALETAKEKLSLGHSVAIFPEGRLNDGRSFHRAGAGAALLAIQSGTPVVPVGFFVPDKYARPIKGHFHQRDTIGRWQLGGQCFVRIGDPWQLATSIQDKANYRELRKITEKMMIRVTELVQQAQEEARRFGVLP
jgi:1-acyl-sn-glycerol-3-phosphate acyltransferase